MKLKLYRYILYFFVVAFTTIVFLSSFEKTSRYLNKHVEVIVKGFFPQSWDFYASDPQQPRYDLYSISATSYHKISGKQSCQFFSRRERRVDIGLSFLVNDLKDESWGSLEMSSSSIVSSLATFNVNFPSIVLEKPYDFIPPGKYLLIRYNCPTREEYRANLSRRVNIIQLELK